VLGKLGAGLKIPGPAMFIDQTQTLVVTPEAEAKILSSHVVIKIQSSSKRFGSTKVVDPIQLSIFAHRFKSIEEERAEHCRRHPFL